MEDSQTRNPWKILKEAFVAYVAAHAQTTRARINLLRAHVLELAAMGRVKLHQSVDNPTSAVPVARQGNIDLYTTAELTRRQLLRSNPAVTDVIRRQWKVMTISSQHDGQRLLDKETYIAFFIGAAALIDGQLPDNNVHGVGFHISNAFGSSYDPVSLRQELFNAWQVDTQFKGDVVGGMTYAQFHNAVFELLDLWTVSTATDDYVDLATALLHHVAELLKPNEPEPVPKPTVRIPKAPPITPTNRKPLYTPPASSPKIMSSRIVVPAKVHSALITEPSPLLTGQFASTWLSATQTLAVALKRRRQSLIGAHASASQSVMDAVPIQPTVSPLMSRVPLSRPQSATTTRNQPLSSTLPTRKPQPLPDIPETDVKNAFATDYVTPRVTIAKPYEVQRAVPKMTSSRPTSASTLRKGSTVHTTPVRGSNYFRRELPEPLLLPASPIVPSHGREVLDIVHRTVTQNPLSLSSGFFQLSPSSSSSPTSLQASVLNRSQIPALKRPMSAQIRRGINATTTTNSEYVVVNNTAASRQPKLQVLSNLSTPRPFTPAETPSLLPSPRIVPLSQGSDDAVLLLKKTGTEQIAVVSSAPHKRTIVLATGSMPNSPLASPLITPRHMNEHDTVNNTSQSRPTSAIPRSAGVKAKRPMSASATRRRNKADASTQGQAAPFDHVIRGHDPARIASVNLRVTQVDEVKRLTKLYAAVNAPKQRSGGATKKR